jgi:hypothetical protein
MKPKTFVAFYIRGVMTGEPIEAVGDRSVVILDARERRETQISYARIECARRGYVGFTICRGTFTCNRVVRALELIVV